MIIKVSVDELGDLARRLSAEAQELVGVASRSEAAFRMIEEGWGGRTPSGITLAVDSLRSRKGELLAYADELAQLSEYVAAARRALLEVDQQLSNALRA